VTEQEFALPFYDSSIYNEISNANNILEVSFMDETWDFDLAGATG